MTDLSPAARAVWEAFNSKFDWVEDGVPGPQFQSIAAALRAAAKQAEIFVEGPTPSTTWGKGWQEGVLDVAEGLLAIADELEGVTSQ